MPHCLHSRVVARKHRTVLWRCGDARAHVCFPDSLLEDCDVNLCVIPRRNTSSTAGHMHMRACVCVCARAHRHNCMYFWCAEWRMTQSRHTFSHSGIPCFWQETKVLPLRGTSGGCRGPPLDGQGGKAPTIPQHRPRGLILRRLLCECRTDVTHPADLILPCRNLATDLQSVPRDRLTHAPPGNSRCYHRSR